MVISRNVKISYDLNGGNGLTLNDENASSLLDYRINVGYAGKTNTEDTEYTFAGWLDESTGILYSAGETARFENPVTLKAQWNDNPSMYSVTLSGGYWPLKDGTDIKTYSVKSNEVEAFVSNLRKEYAGYTPDDYVTDTTIYHYTGELAESRAYRSIGLALKHESSQVKYTVTWIYGNGKEDSTDTCTYGTKYMSLPSYTKEADASATYSFGGWDTDSDGVADHMEGESFTVTGDVTLRIIWVPSYKSYKVRFKVDGKFIDSELSCKVKDTVKVADRFVREGYESSDWVTEDVTVSGGSFVMPAKDVVFTATTSPKSFRVTYNVSGEKWKEENHLCDSQVTAPVPDAPAGKMFTGWTGENVSVNIRTFTMPSHDVVLNAGFEDRPEKKITVLYCIDGSVYEKKVVSPGELLTVPAVIDSSKVICSTAGKVFSGWGSDYIDLSKGDFTLGANDGPIIRIYGTYSDENAANTVKMFVPVNGSEKPYWTLHLDNGAKYELPVYGAITGWTGTGVENNILTVPENSGEISISAVSVGKARSITFETESGGINFGPGNAYNYLNSFTDTAAVGAKYYLPVATSEYENCVPSDWVTLADVDIQSDAGGKYIIVPDKDISFLCWENNNCEDTYSASMQLLLPSGETKVLGTMQNKYGHSMPCPKLEGYTFVDWLENGTELNRFLYFEEDTTIIGRFVPAQTRTGSIMLNGNLVYRAEYFVDGEYLRFIRPDFGIPEFNINVSKSISSSFEVECDEFDNLDDFITRGGFIPLDAEYPGVYDIPYDDFAVSFTTAVENSGVSIISDYPFRISGEYGRGNNIYLPSPGDDAYEVNYTVCWCVYDSAEGKYVGIQAEPIDVTAYNSCYMFTVPDTSPRDDAVIVVTAEILKK